MRRTGLGVIAMGIVGAACGTAPGPNVLTGQPQWEWQRACCGPAGDARDPNTEGYSYVLQYGADGRVRAVRSDQLVIETGYHLSTSGGGPGADPAVTVRYDDPLPLGPGIEPATEHLVVLLANDGLLLRNLASCADCYADWAFLPSLVH